MVMLLEQVYKLNKLGSSCNYVLIHITLFQSIFKVPGPLSNSTILKLRQRIAAEKKLNKKDKLQK